MRLNRDVTVCTLYLFWIVCALFVLMSQSTVYTKSACIIIHGTWAQNETWYRPSGNFFEAVKSCNQELCFVDEIVSFSWSGKLGYLAQLQAAQNLAELIDLYDFVILIGHSQGVTVGIIASQIIFLSTSNGNNLCKKLLPGNRFAEWVLSCRTELPVRKKSNRLSSLSKKY